MSDLLEQVRRTAAAARVGEQIEVYAARAHETDVAVHGGEVESMSAAQSQGVGVRVVVDGAEGYAWAGSLDADVVDVVLAEARENAALGEPDEWAGLPTPSEIGDVRPAAFDVWDESVRTTSAETKIALALDAEQAALGADARVRAVERAGYSDAATETALASSLGVECVTRRTVCSLGVYALAGDGDATRSGFGFASGRAPGDLDAARVARDAAVRSTRLLGSVKPRGRRIPVILDPWVTCSLLALVGAALSGEAVERGRSMFAGRLGEEVASPSVTLVEDPTVAASLGAVPFDGEGVPTRRVTLIDAGHLLRVLHHSASARRAGTTTTGSAVRGYTSTPSVGARSLHLVSGAATAEEILASVPEALYVQSVSGLHSGADAVSGDFSVGAEGLMVRGGDWAEPVREVTVASTVGRFLTDLAAVGSDLVWLPGGGAQTVLVAEMSMSGA